MDDSKNALRAVQYVAQFYNPQNKVTLLNIIKDTEALCEIDSPELTPYFNAQKSSFCSLEEKKRELVNTAMAEAREILITAGFDEKNVAIKTKTKKKGIARDIVVESKEGYTTIIMGRRGLTGAREFFLGSVSQKVLNLARDISVLMVE